MIPAPFDYKKAQSLEEAISLLGQYGYDAKILAGGHSLLPAMKLRLNRPTVVIDISGLAGLDRITVDGDDVVIGANCTHAQIAASTVVREHVKILSETAILIGDMQVRNRGTIGGSLAHADPASDYPATLLATDATVETMGGAGSRSIPASEFFQGIYMTALAEDEIITAIRFPKTAKGVYLKFHQSASRFAVVGCAAVLKDGKLRIGMTGVSDTPYRAEAVESAYDGSDAAAVHAVDGIDVMGDHFASAEYRSHLARVFVKRALQALHAA